MINFYAPGVDAAGHGPDMLKAVAREVRGRIQTPDAMMANEDNLPIFRPFGHHLLHQLLGEKRGALDVNRIPFFPAANINQWELLARSQPFSDFSRRNLHFLIRFVCGKNCIDDIVHWKVVVARANRGQSLTPIETAARAAADVVGTEKRPLSARELLEKFRHRRIGVDYSRHAHGSQRYIISPENQKDRLMARCPVPEILRWMH
jgi:hypothetical protein